MVRKSRPHTNARTEIDECRQKRGAINFEHWLRVVLFEFSFVRHIEINRKGREKGKDGYFQTECLLKTFSTQMDAAKI